MKRTTAKKLMIRKKTTLSMLCSTWDLAKKITKPIMRIVKLNKLFAKTKQTNNNTTNRTPIRNKSSKCKNTTKKTIIKRVKVTAAIVKPQFIRT